MRALRRGGQTVAVVAVDPSSQRTGGALLGDRIRMRSSGTDAGVFIRSMAARDRLGGIAEQTWAAVSILACAFDCVFVETVGVGQSEADVADLVDTLVFVANPGSGDMLQFMKAGLLELVDVFVVNKAERARSRSAPRASSKPACGWPSARRRAGSRPVLLVSARDGAGVDALVDTLAAHRRYALDAGVLRARRASGRERFVLEALTSALRNVRDRAHRRRRRCDREAARRSRAEFVRRDRGARARDRGRARRCALSTALAGELEALFGAVRGACSAAVWSQGVELARAGAVRGEREDGDTVALRVATRGGLVSPSVHLELDPPDWNCDCASREATSASTPPLR